MFQDTEDASLHRTESEASMASAMSSLANSGSLVHSTASMTIGDLAPAKKREDSVEGDAALQPMIHMTKFVLDFSIGTVHLSLTQLAKNMNSDQKLFYFTLERMAAKAIVRTYDLKGTFNIGTVNCEHLLLQTPDGKPVHILTTNNDDDARELLSVKYTDVKRSSPDFQTVHDCVLKKLDVQLSSVRINCHQDALLDLIAKVTKFINEVSSKAKNLMTAGPLPASSGTATAAAKFTDSFALGEDVPDPEAQEMTTASSRGSICLLYTSPSPRDKRQSRMPSSA